MAVTATTSALDRNAIYQRELSEYQERAARWAKIGEPVTDRNLAAAPKAEEAYPAPPRPKKKKKGCWQKTKGVLGKVAKVAVPAVVGFFTGGPVGAAVGAAKGAAGLAQQRA